MYKKTFEVLAKYISKANGVAIQFDTDGGANADMDNDILHLPRDISNSHAYAAISLMMHEAAHIRHSKKIPIDKIVKTAAEFNILNSIEDVRIDIKNFNTLPNVRGFYEELVNEVKANAKKGTGTDLPTKALCWGILYLESFDPKGMFGNEARNLGKKIANPMYNGTMSIDCGLWDELRKTILEIKSLLNIPPDQDPPLSKEQLSKLQMGDSVDGSGGDVNKTLHPELKPGKDDQMIGGSSQEIGSLAMEDQLASEFKEILNVKERKVVDNGSILDVDNLVSFSIGDVGTLFKDEKIIKKKKSKIMFLLDASGSMCSLLIDNQSRSTVVSKAVAKMTTLLDEVSEIEGLNVDWDIGAFRRKFIPLNKATWQQEYNTAGGTELEQPFKEVMNNMLNDYTVDGKRIIIVLTDGEVYDWEIESIKTSIITNSNDVRALIIGVGATGSSKLVKEITGDNIIVAEDNAVPVIMETIKALL